MATAPYGVRLLVGAAVTAVEETLKLPQTILMYPVTVASTVAHIVMKVQQDIAELVTKGDSALESIFPPRDEQPEWATFDEDYADDEAPAGNGERRTEGRFALYSVADAAPAATSAPAVKTAAGKKAPGKTAGASAPAIVEELDYESLTLAQLRARLQSLSVADLEALLAYEEASKSRAPFQTLLANRITRATAK
ncbi:MAG TPA: lipid droplet-associated protein [Mycobacterium sp.]|nr:lipid droplet-associated protein [Mycobacterium sp.]MCB0938947.1 lipid droplet-associated protein [Mycobacterium sp.]MCB9415800.1 lipid droplet-associated protein [Mycolicibacterium sp.]HNP13924.1 lipid droplet-associated protein [Mycobacterium sp.]